MTRNQSFYVDKWMLLVFILASFAGNAQNIGIGTLTPTAPLSFGPNNNAYGQKLVVNANGNVPSFGLGTFDGGSMILRFAEPGTVAFGWGNSSSITEAMRVTTERQVGIGLLNPMVHLDVRSRIHLRGTVQGGTAGIFSDALPFDYDPWYDPPNYLTSYYIGMLDNGSVGIKTMTNEVIRYKGDTKSLAFNGNYGSLGQVLTSNGDGTPPSWKTLNGNIPYTGSTEYAETSSYTLTNAAPSVTMSGLSPVLSFSLPTKARLELNIVAQTPTCSFCGITQFEISLLGNGSVFKKWVASLPNGRTQTFNFSWFAYFATGVNFSVVVTKTSGPNLVLPAVAGRLSSLDFWPSCLN